MGRQLPISVYMKQSRPDEKIVEYKMDWDKRPLAGYTSSISEVLDTQLSNSSSAEWAAFVNDSRGLTDEQRLTYLRPLFEQIGVRLEFDPNS